MGDEKSAKNRKDQAGEAKSDQKPPVEAGVEKAQPDEVAKEVKYGHDDQGLAIIENKYGHRQEQSGRAEAGQSTQDFG